MAGACCGWTAWLAVLGLLAGTERTPAPQHDDPHEATAYVWADSLWADGGYYGAVAALEKFLLDYPASRRAPEATYKLASAYLLLGKTEAADRAFANLVRRHLASPWAQLALRVHIDDNQIVKLADEYRATGRAENAPAATRSAVKLYQAFLARAGTEKAGDGLGKTGKSHSKEEVIYKVGDCLRQMGETAAYRTALDQLLEHDKEGNWGKLAAFRVGDAEKFRTGMEELLHLGGTRDEECRLFLDLAEEHRAGLDGEAQVRCRYYQAHCLDVLKKEPEALAVYRGIVKDHPDSKWAAESAFWLAEHAFRRKEYDRARQEYLAVAEKYPQSPRAAQARQWADWLDKREALWQEAGAVLGELARRAGSGRPSLALEVRLESDDPGQVVQGRLAYQDARQFYLGLAWGEKNVLLASTRDGAWYRGFDQRQVVKARQRLELPLPNLEVKANDDATLSFLFGWSMSSSRPTEPGPLVQMPLSALPIAIAKLQSSVHLSKKVEADGTGGARVVYLVQQPRWDTDRPDTWEITVDEGRMVRQVRWTSFEPDGEKMVWTVSGIALGEPVPETAFEVKLPDSAVVHEVEQLSPLEVIGDLFRLVGALADDVVGAHQR
jgi:TolA-binding protein